jgi:hypothetical protein
MCDMISRDVRIVFPRPKAPVCGGTLAGTVGSNLAGGMDVSLLLVLVM